MKANDHSQRVYFVQKFGNAASIALLDSAISLFTIPSIDGALAYRLIGKCAIVFGDPLCDQQHMPSLAHAFYTDCKKDNIHVIFTMTSEYFTQVLLQSQISKSFIQIGNEIILDPMRDPKDDTGSSARRLRNKYNHAEREGLLFKEYKKEDAKLKEQIQAVAKEWIKHRSGPQIHMLHIDIFAYMDMSRILYAQLEDKVIGVLILNRLDAYDGWVINMLMLSQSIPYGTSEFMIIEAMELLREENCRFLSVGTIPVKNITQTHGLNKILVTIIKGIYFFAQKVFHLSNRQFYWEKFNPQFKPTHLVFPHSSLGRCEIIGILRAFNAKL